MKAGILHIFASSNWGGGEQYVYDLAKRQLSEGYRVTLVAAASKFIRYKVKSLNAHYYILRNRGRFNPFTVLRLRQIILREKIGIIHVHQFKDAFISAFASLFLAVDNRPEIIITRHLVRSGKANRLYRWLYGRLHKLIFVSELAKKTFIETAPVSENKTVVVYNSLPEGRLIESLINYRVHYELPEDTLLAGFLGQLAAFKGVDLLLEAAENVRDKKIVFLLAGVGDKQYELCLKRRIIEKQLEKHFYLVGFVENPGHFAAQMDIGILPSLCVEAFGLSVLEFMRAGIPTIASNTGAQVEFMENGKTGILVTPSVDEVTNALLELWNDKDKRHRIGENARIFCRLHFNYDIFFDQIIKAYGL